MKGFHEFSGMHFDILKEIGSIGAGNAVTSLAKMLNRKVKMEVPVVNLVDFCDIAEFVGGPENLVIGVLVRISGDISGIMMFIVEKESAKSLLDILMSGISHSGDFNEIELSALQEIGNILTSSYLGSLSGMTKTHIKQSVPYLSIDMANAILSVPAIEFGKVADKVLFIESVFSGESENVSGYFLLVPDLPSFEVILKSLGVM